MNPERWQQISELYHSAMERDANERPAFLDQACRGDEGLRTEINRLLALGEQAERFMEAPALDVAAGSLAQEELGSMLGRQISHYQIVSLLGRGGMGEVHLAQDTRLHRKVALKLLPTELTQQADRVRRFEQEAIAASALNHPNIVTIHEIGEADQRHFIVSEFVEGRTLRQRLMQGPVGVDEALEVARQVASALAISHATGIIHRDIKPENLMVRPDGLVKVLDFGLAKLTEARAHVGTQAATDAGVHTDTGAVLGTAGYMSPEQARGGSVTSVADIFSLGVVLYEMAAGQHPFQADSQIGMLHAIITQNPLAPSRLNPVIPAPVEALILRMLEKDSRLRPSAGEVGRALAEVPGTRVRLETSPPLVPKRRTVGRDMQRTDLRNCWSSVVAGRGLIVCVAGEAGIGKTTLVEDFLTELTTGREPCAIARGRCSEQLAGTEAYLPWLDALESLLRVEGNGFLARTMKLLAPTWFAQVAPLATADSSDARTSPETQTGSQDRMKRELAGYFQEISRTQPLVLFLEDLQWADVSTIDVMAYLASGFAARRLLLVVTYRPADMMLARHPFLDLKPDLQARGVCHDLPLDVLSRREIEQYLALEFPEHRLPSDFSTLIYEKTEGSPLFMTDLVRYLRDRQVVSREEGQWILAQPVPDIERDLPESVRGMIEYKVAQLGADDRRLLVAASVQGYEFDSAVVAKVMALDAAETEERLDTLERVYAFVRPIEEREFPDRTLTVRYRFTHVLYQNALYGSLRPTRKAQLSAAVAHTLLSYYGEQSAKVANQLAVLFDTAREFERAAQYFLLAAQHAAGLSAHREAVILARRGLEALKSLPETSERAAQEFRLQTTLGPALMSTLGWGASEVEAAYTRARELCARAEATPPLFPVIWGLWIYWLARAEYERSRELGEQLLALARKLDDPAFLLLAHYALGESNSFAGNFVSGLTHIEQASAIYVPQQHHSLANLYGGYDPGVACRLIAARALWLLGHPDRALRISHEAINLARELSHPFSVAFALLGDCMIQQWCRNVHRVRQQADEALAMATDRAQAPWILGATAIRGWAMAAQGQADEGIAQLLQGVAGWRAWGTVNLPYQLGSLAETYARAGQVEEGLRAVDEALAIIERTHEGLMEAEIHRLKGELLLMRASPDEREAETCFREAVEIAAKQRARSLELRAVTSLSRLLQKQNKPAEAREMLAEIYGWFTEGFETPDLKDARMLLSTFAQT